MRRSARLIGLRSMTSARRARHVGRRFGPLLVALSINVFLLCKVTSADSEAGADADAGGRGSGCGRDIVNLQSKCVLSPVVFEGSVLVTGHSVHDSWTTARLKVSLVHKGDVEENWVVNVGFHGEREEEETNGQCVFRRDIFQVSKKYLVFAAWDLVGTTGNASTATPDARDRLVVFSEPVLRSKNSSRIVRKTLCSGCIKEPSVSGLKSRTARPNSKVQLKCKAKGNPVPDITWFKDDHPVTRTENIIINQTKTISKLTIKKMSTSDVGTYECRATSAFGPPASSKASLRLGAGSKIRPTLKPSSTMGPDKSRPCGGYDEYCLNGGKCFFYETLGEYVCQCAEGYKGRRCESKGVYHHGTVPMDSMGIDANTRMLSLYWGK